MSKSVAIVGGGIVGLCSAYYLARAGFQVTVLERGPSDQAGCSLGNAGMIVPSHFEPLAAPGMVGLGLKMMLNPQGPFAVRPSLNPELIRWAWRFARSCNRRHVANCAELLRDLNLASRALYLEMEGDFNLECLGLLMLCRTESALHEEAELAARATALGLDAAVLSASELKALEPDHRMDVAGAVHFRDDCQLDPVRLMAWLAAECSRLGVTLIYDAEVTDAVKEGSQVRGLKGAFGELSADEIVLAAGSWSGGFARTLGLCMPMQAGKGYSFDLHGKRTLQRCAILVGARVAVTPMADRIRFAGTMEITGNDLSINRRRLQGIRESIPRFFPDVVVPDEKDLDVWAGLRPCSADGMPYLGRPAGFENLIVATGHSMMGVSLGPVTGKIVTSLVMGEETGFKMKPMAPDRFA